MNSTMYIPQGEDTILIEMTIKEALALSGAKFNDNHKIETGAIKKVKRSLENRLLTTTK